MSLMRLALMRARLRRDPCGIAIVIERYIDDIVDEINADPEGYFANNYRFWNDLDKEALKAEKDLIQEHLEIEEEKEIA